MTDELTPEEKEALKKLPREKVPSAELEARVVGALRERGVLAKRRRRTVEITNSRVVGLLAACVALVIGAYSIGLHRGGGDQMLSRVATVVPRPDDRGNVEVPRTGAPETPMTDAPEAKPGRSEADEVREAEPSVNVTDAEKGEVTAPKEESVAEARTEPPARPDKKTAAEPAQVLEDQEEELAKRPAEVPVSPPQEIRGPKTMMKESVRMAQPEPEGMATLAAPPTPAGEPPLVFPRTLSFLLNGIPVVVDAPDSVRITRDDLGQMIIIYTTDGPIRFRLADED